MIDKGAPPKGNRYLQCDKARNGLGCDKTLARYDKLEPLLLHFCRELDARDLLTDEAEKARAEARLRQKVQAINGELAQIRRQVDSLAESISRTENVDMKQVLEEKLATVLARKAELEQSRSKIVAQQRKTAAEAVAEHLASVEDLITQMGKLQGDERSELRRRLRHALRQLIDRIEIKAERKGTWLRIDFLAGSSTLLLLDGKGGPRFVRDDSGDAPLIYQLDGQGNVLDVDADLDEAGDNARADQQVRVDQKVAKALRRRALNPNMIG